MAIIKPYSASLLAIVAAHFIVFSIWGISRHWGYITSLNDLGCYDQAIWGVIHKGFLLHSFDSFGSLKLGNWLGIHFNPILYFFAPFYYLIPTVNWIIFAQSTALSLAALPIFLLAKQVTKSEKQALLWGIIYLFNPFVLNADAWDFHPVSFATPFVALGFLAIEQQKPRLFALVNLTLLLCQEEFGLTVACFGLLYGLKNKEKQVSSLFLGLGIVAFILVLTVIMPALSPTKQHYMFSPTHGNSRYSWLGESLKDAIKTLALSPGYVFNTVMFNFQGLVYIGILFIPVLFTALAAPLFMLPISADLLANILSENALPRSISSYHSVAMIPGVTIAAIYGCQRIYRYCSLLSALNLVRCSCISTIMFGYWCAPFPLPFAGNIWRPVHFIASYDHREDEIKTMIENQSVSAQVNIGAHFSYREKIYLFPRKAAESDYVILWVSSPTTLYDFTSSTGDIERIEQHIGMNPRDYLIKIEELLGNKNFTIAYWNDPWLVFKRGAKDKDVLRKAQVLEKIRSFKKKLQISSPSPL